MKDLKTPDDLQRMLEKPFAVCFIHLKDWIPARAANIYLGLLERQMSLSKEKNLKNIFRADPWKHRFLHAWIYSNPALQFRTQRGDLTCVARLGTLVWIQRGKIIGVERKILKRDIEVLWDQTQRLHRKCVPLSRQSRLKHTLAGSRTCNELVRRFQNAIQKRTDDERIELFETAQATLMDMREKMQRTTRVRTSELQFARADTKIATILLKTLTARQPTGRVEPAILSAVAGTVVVLRLQRARDAKVRLGRLEQELLSYPACSTRKSSTFIKKLIQKVLA